jgi:AcrR family transcriptional regulator
MASNRRGRETRDRILDATAEVFSKYGYDASIEEIGRAAGTTRVTVHRHFASRDELLNALLVRDGAGLAERITATLESDAPVRERMTATIVLVVRHVRTTPWLFALVTAGNPSARWSEVDPDERFLDALVAFFRPYTEAMAAEATLRASVDETLDWVLRQALLMMTAPGRHGDSEDALRWEIETFVLPAIFDD